MTQVKGFELFDDIVDRGLRTRNQAVVITNIIEDNSKLKKLSARGAHLVLSYFNQVPDVDKTLVHQKVTIFAQERGFV